MVCDEIAMSFDEIFFRRRISMPMSVVILKSP